MLIDLCAFVLNDRTIDGQMLGMQVVIANRLKHAVSTSCELRV